MSATIAAVFVATGLRLVASHAYAEGAPPGFSGGFKEETCHACHFHETLNAAPGRVTIDGVPERFVPGQTYALTVTLTRAGMKRAGFQLSARFKDSGKSAGTIQAGRADGARVKIESEGDVQYANQQKAGSTVAVDGVATWTIEWTPPVAGGAVVFNVAANAADGNESADGDFIYTMRVDTAPAPVIAGHGIHGKRNYVVFFFGG